MDNVNELMDTTQEEVLAELRDWIERKAWMGSMPGKMVASTCAKAEAILLSQAQEIERLKQMLKLSHYP
jgi:hypothetical protein